MIHLKLKFILFYVLHFIVVRSIPVQKSGPYTSTLVRAEKCKDPSPPYLTDLPGDVTLQLFFNTNKKPLLRGNFTAYEPDPGLKLTIQDFFLVNGQWHPTFRITGMSCRGRVVAMMGQIFDIKFNKKTCAVPKGFYIFNNIDYDFVDHIFLMEREYGRVLRKVTVSNKMGTVVCLELECNITAKTP